ncbi:MULTISPECIES: FABP family protein [unclassified Rhodococcus (in: high G+C Gram-positive bacteria)]|uniref:FABP family protein n=1 Tax=unclassified Rhodococcus (in: high G+C Gram-positive bacteria) TaxID=192944 RepID=UPI001639DE35|nr:MULTISPECIES: FABP family protein [unclassified Rhodococcus (in: high G+C Gram-positive bacteria)]MBC2642911.1 FABP family protein [Rhodococcus sp. 3A]MBC2892347.1 FABP family protein [Rhodococcus sp. 4CII]
MDENSTLSPAHSDATASSSADAPLLPFVPDALAPFAGHWRGEGEGAYPTIDDFAYTEEIEFDPTGKPFLAYRSRTWELGSGRPLHTESGYLRLVAEDEAELLVAQPTGFAEIHRGQIREGIIELSMASLGASPDAKPVHSIRRQFSVRGGDLTYDLWMAHDLTPLTHHLHGHLRRD